VLTFDEVSDERRKPFAAKSVVSMLASQRKASAETPQGAAAVARMIA